VVSASKLVVLFASMIFALFVVGTVALAAVINGTAGDDTLDGTSKSASFFGYGGIDTITRRGVHDTLHGEGGNDTQVGDPATMS
jgi:Ca2+-binding RTX toxin-like protein